MSKKKFENQILASIDAAIKQSKAQPPQLKWRLFIPWKGKPCGFVYLSSEEAETASTALKATGILDITIDLANADEPVSRILLTPNIPPGEVLEKP